MREAILLEAKADFELSNPSDKVIKFLDLTFGEQRFRKVISAYLALSAVKTYCLHLERVCQRQRLVTQRRL